MYRINYTAILVLLVLHEVSWILKSRGIQDSGCIWICTSTQGEQIKIFGKPQIDT